MKRNELKIKDRLSEKVRIIHMSNRIKKIIEWVVEKYQNIKRAIQPYYKRIFDFFAISLIMVIALFLFLYLVDPPPISTTPSLIMVWASVIVLLVGLFPGILERIKSIKVKDFELGLQETVAKASSQGFVSISDLDLPIFSTKEHYGNLTKIFSLALRFPNKPVLLVVNLKKDNYISIIMLQIYLFFLDLVGKSIFVLFISTRRKIQIISDIEKDSIIGAVSGRKVIQTFFRRFPDLYRIFDFRTLDSTVQFEQIIRGGIFSDPVLTNFFKNVHNIEFSEGNHFIPQYLTKRDVKEWFYGQLSNYAIDSSISVADLKTVRKALIKEDEFIMIYENRKLESLASLCFLAKDISKKVITEAA